MSAAIVLPNGLRRDGAHHRTATLRALTGEDEVVLRERGRRLPPAERATLLLATCVDRVGSVAMSADVARALTAGDRDALLLHVRRDVVGEHLHCLLRCPPPGCGRTMDVDLRIRDLLVPPRHDAPETHEETISVGEGTLRVRFRLPTGADLEAAAPLGSVDVDEAILLLARRCVLEARDPEGRDVPVEAWPPEALDALSERLEALDPQAEIRLRMGCPECGAAFRALFDPGPYLLGELGAHAHDLYREVHTLAFHYHWSAGDILRMPRDQRRIYLDLLAESLGEVRVR